MGIRYRKSKKIGPVRITASKSGLSASIGVKGLRVTKLANGRVRTTASIPGAGISYVKEGKTEKARSATGDKKKGCLGRFFLAFLLVCFAYGVLTNYIEKSYLNVSSVPVNVSDVVLPTEAPTSRSVFQAKEAPTDLLKDIEEKLEAEFSNGFKLNFDESTNALDIGIFISEEEYQHFYEKSFYEGDVSDWYGILGDVEDVTNEIRKCWRESGFLQSAFIVNVLFAEKTNNIIVATFANGSLVYDKINDFAAVSLKNHDETESYDSRTATISQSYVVNTNTNVFHRPTCSAVKRISSENKGSSSQSRDSLIASGYSPCHICNP